MHGNHPLTSEAPSRRRPDAEPEPGATTGPLQAVEEAAALNPASDFAHEHSAPELQAAVAAAVLDGAQIKDVAVAAHMTALEVLDAADSFSTARDVPTGPGPGPASRLSPGRV
jgi:hypothetical protein